MKYSKEYYNIHAEQIKAANMAYQRRMKSITVRLKPADKDKYTLAASQANMSLRAFVLAAMDEKIEHDGLDV